MRKLKIILNGSFLAKNITRNQANWDLSRKCDCNGSVSRVKV